MRALKWTRIRDPHSLPDRVGSEWNRFIRIAMDNYVTRSLKVSPYLLPNLCANLPAGKAGMLLGFTGPIFSPQGACASGNHAIGIGARMIRDGIATLSWPEGLTPALFRKLFKVLPTCWQPSA